MPRSSVAALVTAMFIAPALAEAQDVSRPVAGAGISVPGWTGKVDPNEVRAGRTINDARLVKEGDALHATTGPASIFWNLANQASGEYTVKATFREPKYMALNDHPHPYGLMVAGNDLDTDQASFLYCAAYGNGTFIVRGFGPAAFRAGGGPRGEANPAVKKAAGPGEPVTQEIAVSVKSDKVECAINGTVVGSYPKADLVKAFNLTDRQADDILEMRLDRQESVGQVLEKLNMSPTLFRPAIGLTTVDVADVAGAVVVGVAPPAPPSAEVVAAPRTPRPFDEALATARRPVTASSDSSPVLVLRMRTAPGLRTARLRPTAESRSSVSPISRRWWRRKRWRSCLGPVSTSRR